MALSDSEREKSKKRPSRAIEAGTNRRWSDKQKLDAITTYLTLGNLSMTSRITNIPEITLRVWKQSNWWQDAVEDIKSQERVELSAKLKRIVEAAHQVVENRLVNGDPVIIPKTGEIVMKPVSMKDAHRVAVDLQNQREIVEKMNKHEEVVESDSDQLKKLAERFAEFATKKIEQTYDKTRTIDMEMVEDVKEKYVEVAQDDSVSDNLLSHNPGTTDSLGEEEQNSFSPLR